MQAYYWIVWIIVGWIASFLISRPFIKIEIREGDIVEKIPYVSDNFILNYLALIPFVNLWIGYYGFRTWLTFKIVKKMINTIKKRHKDNPELTEKLDNITESLDENSKLTE